MSFARVFGIVGFRWVYSLTTGHLGVSAHCMFLHVGFPHTVHPGFYSI
jgi:hypothetical protein